MHVKESLRVYRLFLAPGLQTPGTSAGRFWLAAEFSKVFRGVKVSDVSTIEQSPRLLPPRAPRPPATPGWQEQDGTLREMWVRNATPQAIAEALGRSIPAIMTRAARLGLPRRAAPGRKPGTRTPVEGGQAMARIAPRPKAAISRATRRRRRHRFAFALCA